MYELTEIQDLFFEFPWNNFLHSVVYDLIHQVLTGRIDTGYNRELTVSLFRDARLMHRIIEGSQRNDVERSVLRSVYRASSLTYLVTAQNLRVFDSGTWVTSP